MEWSLTQNKLLAFHRLMRTDKPIGALLLLWPTLWAPWVATPGIPPGILVKSSRPKAFCVSVKLQ